MKVRTILHVLMEVKKSCTFLDFRIISFTKNAEKARIEAGIIAAKIAARMRAQTDLKQKRERQRLELEKVLHGILNNCVCSFLKNYDSNF